MMALNFRTFVDDIGYPLLPFKYCQRILCGDPLSVVALDRRVVQFDATVGQTPAEMFESLFHNVIVLLNVDVSNKICEGRIIKKYTDKYMGYDIPSLSFYDPTYFAIVDEPLTTHTDGDDLDYAHEAGYLLRSVELHNPCRTYFLWRSVKQDGQRITRPFNHRIFSGLAERIYFVTKQKVKYCKQCASAGTCRCVYKSLGMKFDHGECDTFRDNE